LAGVVLIGAGLFVFRYPSEIANQVGTFISPPPEGENNPGTMFTQGSFLPFAVWGFGFTLIGIGAAMIRSAFMTSMIGSMGMPAMGGGGGMSPEMLDAYMQQAVSATPRTGGPAGAPESAKEVVKIKCRTCGSLESEDAAFCRKCGNPL
jgi:ribosomal protein L40E